MSPRTVSRVVNDEGGFSEATRVKVLEAVEDLGYQPNMLARGLITRRSGTVGLVGVDMTDPFFPAMAEGIQNEARETGRTMFFASNDGDPQRQAEVFRSLWSHAVDGVIVFPAPGSIEQLTAYARRGMPLVIVDDIVEFPQPGLRLLRLGGWRDQSRSTSFGHRKTQDRNDSGQRSRFPERGAVSVAFTKHSKTRQKDLSSPN